MNFECLTIESPSSAFYTLKTDRIVSRLVYGDRAWASDKYDVLSEDGEFVATAACKNHPEIGYGHTHLNSKYRAVRHPPDFAFMWQAIGTFFVHHRTRGLFEEAGIAGIEYTPTSIRTPKGATLDYAMVKVLNRVQPARSAGVYTLYKCPDCGWEQTSSFSNLEPDLSTWEGGDFAVASFNPNFIFASRKAIDLILSHSLTNCALVDPKSVRWGDMVKPEQFVTAEMQHQMMGWYGAETLEHSLMPRNAPKV